MLIPLVTFLTPCFRWRAALELENLTPCHQNRRASAVGEEAPEIDAWGPAVVGLVILHLS